MESSHTQHHEPSGEQTSSTATGNAQQASESSNGLGVSMSGTQHQSSLSDNQPRDRYQPTAGPQAQLTAAIYSTSSTTRQCFRQSFAERQSSAGHVESFEATFPHPAGERLMSDPRQAARELEECCLLYQANEPASASPMERWVAASPEDEPTYVDWISFLRAYRPYHGYQTAVGRATSRHHHTLAQETSPGHNGLLEPANQSRITHGASIERTPASMPLETTRAVEERQRNSWLDLDDSASPAMSSSGSGVSTPEHIDQELQPRDPGEMVRMIIATFGAVGSADGYGRGE
ncbi:uncharacterized protein LTR77_009430 [Saxophila tyrrhenica]|uniref:Uncharacterized protein n=1 Tax=Saxophila tyrrhenica TaxID=1690608 RepID=A0AAV9P1H8_9PEZI|nr:hypothetical protein LTR77_009430 [Saxophila tyrrhenica]